MYQQELLDGDKKDLQVVPDQGVSKEELALEKKRTELISSLFEDWVYEYNIAGGFLTTISGNAKQYPLVSKTGEGQDYFSLEEVHPDDRQKLQKCSKGIPDAEGKSYAEIRILCEETYRWFSLTTRLLCDTDGVPVSVLGRFSDIDKKKREELRLREEASKDSLTGLLNRTAFWEESERILREAAEGKRPHLAVLILDIDNFKSVNDSYGHLYGDTVLMMMAESMREVSSEGDLLGRFGGDEFIILFQDYKDTEALKKQIEQLRATFFTACEADKETVNISCSVGAAVYGKDGVTLEELLANADNALYYVKENGKDGYVLCTEEIKKLFSEERRKQKREKPISKAQSVLDEVTRFALDLLEGSEDLKSAIHILLTRIGKRFGLGSITVREEDEEQGYLLSYYWYDEKKTSGIADKVRISASDRMQMTAMLRENSSLEFSDLSELPQDSVLYRIYSVKGIKSLMRCPFFSEGKVFGYMSYVDCVQSRVWKEEERHSLNVISRIIGNYLAREKAYRKIEQKVELMKSHDELTGLLRYDKFKETAQNILETSGDRERYALVSTDIAHFKYFNEVYGFRSGDEVLGDFATLVVKNNPRAVAACRDFADNFLIMVTVSSVENLLHNIRSYNKTFSLNEAEKFMDSNLELCSGAFLIDHPKEGIQQAIDNANIARKLVKEKGTSGLVLFEPSMKINRLKEIALLHMLEEAIEDEEFCVFLQPQISFATGELVGAEALARWRKPSGLVALPNEFVPVLEKSGKIIELDYFMYLSVLKMLRSWKRNGLKQVRISVNLSRRHLQSTSLVAYLVRCLNQYEIDSSLIEIEITESAFIDNQEALIQKVNEIKEQGFRVAIDDFGKGYSSLSMLTAIPADYVKIDKDFLKEGANASSRGMLYNVIHLLKDNQMSVVCEGVEEAGQAEFLQKAGCDIGQGFYFSPPLPVKEFEKKYLMS